MKPLLEEPDRRSHPPLWAQVRGWSIALTSVALLVGLLDARSDIQHGLLIAIVVVDAIVPWALVSLAIMMVSVMALLWWARSPSREMVLKTGSAICICTLIMALGLLGLTHLTGVVRAAGTILYMGFGGAAIMFMEFMIPKWEERGFLRHPKVTSDSTQPVTAMIGATSFERRDMKQTLETAANPVLPAAPS